MKIRLVMLGKTRRPEIRALLDDYLTRIRHYAEIETHELRQASDTALRRLKLDSASTRVLLDAAGRQFTSMEFARWLAGLRDAGTRQVAFFCGDAEGFPEGLSRSAHFRLSLSSLTLPHELARVVLAEQIYRAFTIWHRHPYPK